MWIAALVVLALLALIVAAAASRRRGLPPPRLPPADSAQRPSEASSSAKTSLVPLTPRRGRSAPRDPVIFVHGLFGFDTVRVAGLRQDYFRGLPASLRAMGADARFARLAPAASVRVRGEQLARFVREQGGPRVHLVAHSLGGVDARYAISALGLGDRVLSLTTIGTPHRGTPLADLGAGALDRLRLRLPAVRDLTTARAAAFNDTIVDVRSVMYGSVLGVARGLARVPPPLAPAYLYLQKSAGANDGLVTAASQRWGEVLAVIDADHWAQVGWSRHFDAFDFYAELLRELAARDL